MQDKNTVLEAILATAPDAIIRIDRQGKILDFLGSAEESFGYSADEILGRPIETLMLGDDSRDHDRYIRSFMDTGDRKLPDFGRRLQAKRKDGSIFPVEIALSQIGSGEAIQFVGIVRDITKRVEQDTMIMDLAAAQEQASRNLALGETATAMAHELNQPLTAIANYSDALEIKLGRIEDDSKEALIALARKAGDQARLCGEIVKRMRRTLKFGEYSSEPGDFHGAVRQSAELLASRLGAENIELVVKQNGDGRAVNFNRIQLHQVLANLVSNAMVALQAAEVKKVTIISETRADEVELRVVDTGAGVPDERKQKIFESFVSESLSGLGLGLAIVKRIASAHEGHIWVEDNPEGGAIFRMVLPSA